MKKLFFSLALTAIPIQSLFALSTNIEVTCSPDLVAQYSCNQCFDAGYLYENQSMPLADRVKNVGGLEADYYQSELVMPTIGNIGAGIVTFNTPVFQISSTFTTNGLWDNGKGEFYTYLNPGDDFRWIETKPGYDIGFSSINKSLVTDANRASIRDKNFTVVYTIHPRYWNNTLSAYTPPTSQTHVECQTFGAHFCGDGVVESAKETCDDGGDNGKVGKCNTSCTGIVPPVVTPACTSLIASPTFGSSPLTTSLVCIGKDLPAGSTYAIQCGNGTNAVMIGNAGSCTYTNASATVSATYNPKCTINGTISSTACETNVGVNPIVIPACIPGIVMGSQLAPLTATSSNLCPAMQLVSGFTANTVGTTTTYQWACNGSLVGGACSATYTPSVCTPFVSIKKYANTQDGQVVADALSLNPGDAFNYRYDVTNSGGVVATGVVVTDTFPQYVTLGAITAPTGWTCNKGSKVVSGVTYPTVVCTTASLAANSTISITVGATLSASVPANTQLRNIVYVCKTGDAPTTNCTPGCVDPLNPSCTPPPPPPNCSPIVGSPNYDPACVIVTPTGPVISIKKYANTQDGQVVADALSLNPGDAFNYRYDVTNSGGVVATGVVVTDTFPQYVTLGAITAPTGWTCNKGSKVVSGVTYPTVVCTTASLAANSTISITVGATLSASVPANTQLRNIVYVCKTGDAPTTNCTPGCVDPLNPSCTPPPPPPNCSPIVGSPNYDPACVIVTPTGPVISIKKYANTQDGQVVADALSLNPGDAFNYRYDVTNSGGVVATGVVVTDTFPQYVTLGAITAPTGWTCNKGSKVVSGVTYPTVVCTTASLAANSTISITVGATLSASVPANTQLRNIVYVCKTGDAPTTNCTPGCVDPLNPSCTPPPPPPNCSPIVGSPNYDPACVIIIPPGGGSSNIGKKCVNGVATCANYNTLLACIADGIPASLCYAADSVGYNSCQSQSLSCSGPGGCTNPGGCGPNSSGYCGDGVLQSGEECDVKGAAWCIACKVDMTTNPGANPISDLWMTIPVLARTQHLGYTWLDGIPGKVAFPDNRMVLGVGTKAFTLADTVGFGIQTRYRIPLILEANKKVCLKSDGSSLNSETVCTSFGMAADLDPTKIEKWQRADGVWFVNIGVGDYQKYNPNPRPPAPAVGDSNYAVKLQNYYDWRQYTLEKAHSANNITLFRGPTQYQMPSGNMGPTLNSAFFARQVGTDGIISMLACSGSNCSPTAVVELVKLPVRVSSAVVSSVGSSSNRYLENFLNPGNLFAGFLGSTNGYTSTTNSNSNITVNHTVTLPVIIGGTAGSVSSITDIEKYAVNGNKNVLAVNGNLTIESCVSNTFVMQGVRTVIVTGDIIIKCNIAYASNDTLSSWAWISKGGNIQVYNGIGSLSVGAVTNLAGVYVALKDGTTGGNITYTGNNTTQAILRVEGSLYGNATSLFNSRLYARANGAYDILTTGTILTYSNRALVSPPPLLSQYLGNYQVQRVIQ